MKKSILKIALFSGALLLGSQLMAQKTNVTSAAIEYKKYQPMSGDIEGSKKALENGKRFIDLAAEHPDTKEDDKMRYYRGVIYFGLMEMSQLDAKNPVDEKTLESYMEIARNNLAPVYKNPKSKFNYDAKGFIESRFNMAFSMGLQMFEAKKYDQAGQLFVASYEIKKLVDDIDSNSMKNAIACMNNSISGFITAKQYDSIIERVELYKKAFPNEMEPMKIQMQVFLEQDKIDEAERVVKEALAINPNDKNLYFIIGTIYVDLKQNEKALENLKRALEIDPDFTDAQYQLGAHLNNWSADITTEANQLPFGDVRVDVMKADANEKRKQAAELLEKYIVKDPTNKPVLQLLFEVNYKLGNKEKAMDFKKRAEAIK
jgi:tetratricopeptide (TPR) repeat protein